MCVTSLIDYADSRYLFVSFLVICVQAQSKFCWKVLAKYIFSSLILQDECSFVSLRDVERAMIVFEYMYEMVQKLFGKLMDEWGRGERTDVETEREIRVG